MFEMIKSHVTVEKDYAKKYPSVLRSEYAQRAPRNFKIPVDLSLEAKPLEQEQWLLNNIPELIALLTQKT